MRIMFIAACLATATALSAPALAQQASITQSIASFESSPPSRLVLMTVGASNGCDIEPPSIERELRHGLSSWARIATVTGTTAPIFFSDERLPGETENFYRSVR